jgi:hypothetical protein
LTLKNLGGQISEIPADEWWYHNHIWIHSRHLLCH